MTFNIQEIVNTDTFVERTQTPRHVQTKEFMNICTLPKTVEHRMEETRCSGDEQEYHKQDTYKEIILTFSLAAIFFGQSCKFRSFRGQNKKILLWIIINKFVRGNNQKIINRFTTIVSPINMRARGDRKKKRLN